VLAILLEEQKGIAAKESVPTKTPKENISSACCYYLFIKKEALENKQ
jgi:hypothetical protein